MFSISAIQTVLYILIGNSILEIPLTEIRYWAILFSCSCWANMVGLNISASFDSAVTIYILIPLVIIPNLLLSGVVIPFDKFNPMVGKPTGVPVLGEMMPSRWAYEAFMVTQFKDNPFQKSFYPIDQKIKDADYRKLYYIPELEKKVSYCFNHRSEWQNRNAKKLESSLNLLQNEIRNELKYAKQLNFPEVNRLAIGKIDSTVLEKTSKFLQELKKFYANRTKSADEERERLIASRTNTSANLLQYETERRKLTNKAVIEAVENRNAVKRIVEFKGDLIQKIYPIYIQEHKPSHFFDFSANLYQPTKYFAGRDIYTIYFNIAVIWFMTGLFFITLYFDVLKRLIKRLEGSRKYRVKEK